MPRSPVRSLQPALFAGETDREPGIPQGVAEARPELLTQGILTFDGPLLTRRHQNVQFQIEAATAFGQMAVALDAMALAQRLDLLLDLPWHIPLGGDLQHFP